MKIYKYVLSRLSTQFVHMPINAKIMDIQMQADNPTMWAMVDPDSEMIDVRIDMYATGEPLRDSDSQYLATVQDGDFVWHFFVNYDA